MQGPQVHPSYLNSLTQIFREHTFYITGFRSRLEPDKIKLTKFTYLYPMQSNVKIELPWNELIQNKTWEEKYDLFIGETEGKLPQILAPYTDIPKVWRTFSILDPHKVKYLGGPVVFNSYTARNFSIRLCRKHEALTRTLGDYVAYDYKNPILYKGWTGNIPAPLIVTHNFSQRAAVGYELYKQLDPNLNIKIIEGNISFDDLRRAYREHRCFLELTQGGRLITGTLMEAMMTGMPIISTPESDFPIFVRPWIEGFLTDNPKRIEHFCTFLKNDFITASDMGHNSRLRALELCSLSKVKKVWEEAIHEVTKPGHWSDVPNKWRKL